MNTVDKPVADEEDLPPGVASGYRTRARQRLIGAIVLALGVAILMPVFFHGEPRMPRPELRITMPSRDAALEDAMPAAAGGGGENRTPVASHGGSSGVGAEEAQRRPGGEMEGATQASGPGSATKATAVADHHASAKADAKADSKADAKADPVAKLDASALQDRLLGPALGVKDPRTDARLDFVGGVHGTAALEKKVRSGEAAAAFSLPAVSLAQIFAVADADQIMPPKSTWFEPKLRSGLFVHRFGPPRP